MEKHDNEKSGKGGKWGKLDMRKGGNVEMEKHGNVEMEKREKVENGETWQ